MDNLRGLLGIRRMDSPECTEMAAMRSDERIDEGVLRWFAHVERMENDMTGKRVYVEEYSGNRLVGRPRRRWIDTVKDCLKKSDLDIRQARRIVHDMSVWRRFVKGNALGVVRRMNP